MSSLLSATLACYTREMFSHSSHACLCKSGCPASLPILHAHSVQHTAGIGPLSEPLLIVPGDLVFLIKPYVAAERDSVTIESHYHLLLFKADGSCIMQLPSLPLIDMKI